MAGSSLRPPALMSVVPTPEWAQHFAEAWIAAWNSQDLERIFSHYRDDFEMRSPLVVTGGFGAEGVLKGKDAIRPYWGAGIAAKPINFKLIKVFAGVRTVAILYRNIGRGKLVIERIELDEQGFGVRAEGIYVDDDGMLGVR
ncbi:MAG: nuclear transport factor 2 family protein [Sphingobium sp.]|nr:nuclear transport factor 2 family protein [Sphingobium sp.]